jgi:predicted GIY-YIG superfamily endonuclease
MADYFVYVLTNKPRGTLYVGVTNNLVRRIHEHREGMVPGFSKRYGLKQLAHFEKYDTPALAIQREKKHQTLVADLEARSCQFFQSAVARSLYRYHSLKCVMDARVKPGHDALRVVALR